MISKPTDKTSDFAVKIPDKRKNRCGGESLQDDGMRIDMEALILSNLHGTSRSNRTRNTGIEP